MTADSYTGNRDYQLLAKKVFKSGYNGSIVLQTSMKSGKLSFAINYNDQVETLIDGIDASYLSTSKARGFVGTTMGIYATSNQ